MPSPRPAASRLFVAGLVLAAVTACTSPQVPVTAPTPPSSATVSPAQPLTDDASSGTSTPAGPAVPDHVLYGPTCTAQDVQEPADPEDVDAHTSLQVARSQVGMSLPASEHTVLEDSVEAIAAGIVRIEAGASTVEINASATIVVVEGDIDTLIVNGSAVTVWVEGAEHVVLGEEAGGSYVFWSGTAPQLEDRGVGNAVASAQYAVQVHYYC